MTRTTIEVEHVGKQISARRRSSTGNLPDIVGIPFVFYNAIIVYLGHGIVDRVILPRILSYFEVFLKASV